MVNLLFVKDKAIILQDISTKLEKKEYRVYKTGSPTTTIEKPQMAQIQYAIMDINLNSDINGIDTAKMIKDSYSKEDNN